MKQVVIYRGLPGSGKTTLQNRQYPDGIVCSADEYRKELASTAHLNCFKKYLDILYYKSRYILDDPESLAVVVDYTNISAYEIAPYYQAALAYGWETQIVTVWTTPEIAMSRNVHEVPATTILDMYRRLLTEQLPPWWKHSVELPFGNK